MNRRLILTKFVTKLSTYVSHAFGYHGTSLPGWISYLLYPGILKELSKDVTTVLITGTNGKSTTTAFVSKLLGPEEVFTNSYGSNMETGIITSFLENTDSRGNAVKHIAVMECDECNLPLVARFIRHPVVAVLNVYQEQQERYGGAGEVTDSIIRGIEASEAAQVCVSRDQEDLFRRLAEETAGIPAVTYSAVFPDADVYVEKKGEKVNVRTRDLCFESDFTVPGEFNVSNLAAAVSVLEALGRCTESRLQRIVDLSPVEWHLQKLDLGGHTVMVYLVKNTESQNRCMKLVRDDGTDLCFFFDKSIVDGESSDWIREADYKNILSGRGQDECQVQTVCAGDFSKSIANSFKKADLGPCIQMKDRELFRYIRDSHRDLTVLANVRAMKKLRKEFSR